MNRLATMRGMLTVGLLTLAWCGLWRQFSVGNVAAGAAIGLLLVISGIGPGVSGGVRVIPLVKLAGLVLVDLARSTWSVAYEVLTPPDNTRESVVAVELPADAEHHRLLLTIAITLTPGTAVIDLDGTTLYLHLLHHDRRDATVTHAKRLARLACAALPVDASAPHPTGRAAQARRASRLAWVTVASRRSWWRRWR
ncbi:MAG: Na+/H+ antiporter subunit E [Actinomycetota bacterium]